MSKSSNSTLSKLKRFCQRAFRQAYVRANVEHGLAHQIRALRQGKSWSQLELAQELGVKRQSTIARLEDPSYGRYTLATLLKLASVFDVALLVKFVSYGTLMRETDDLSPNAIRPQDFDEEYPKLRIAIERHEKLGFGYIDPVSPSVKTFSGWPFDPKPYALSPSLPSIPTGSTGGENRWLQ